MPWVMWCLSPKDRMKWTQDRDQRGADRWWACGLMGAVHDPWGCLSVPAGARPLSKLSRSKFSDSCVHGVPATINGDGCLVLWGSWSFQLFQSSFYRFLKDNCTIGAPFPQWYAHDGICFIMFNLSWYYWFSQCIFPVSQAPFLLSCEIFKQTLFGIQWDMSYLNM